MTVMRMFFFAVALVALLLPVRADAQVCQSCLNDAIPPVLQLPPNQTREATGPGGEVVTFSVSASDNVDDDVWVRCSPESWSTFVLGTTTVSCTAKDHMNNTAAGSFTVTVRDTTPPVLTLPIVPTMNTTNPQGTVVSFSGSALDTVSGNVPVVFNPASGSTFPVGTTSVTATATDAAGNTITKSFTVTVVIATIATRAIGINFVGSSPTAMGSTETAGVVTQPNWNNATGATRTSPLALVDESGAASGATVTWSAASTWRTPAADQPGNQRMMRGYLNTTDTSVTTATVTGLALRSWDVYVYMDGDNGSLTRTAAYRISGSGITTTSVNATDSANTNFAAAFTRATNSAGNYVKFTVTAAGFTITATPGTSTGTRRAPLNAIQIVPAAPAVPDFTLAATPVTTTVAPGNGTSYTVTVGALNGFSALVGLAVSGAPAGVTTQFAPASVMGSGPSTLTVTTAAGTAVGSYPLTITGTSGALSRTASVNLVVGTVTARAIGINFVGSSPAAMGSTETAGVVAKRNWNNATGATRTSPLALVDESGAASGATVTWSAASTWRTPAVDQPGNQRMMRGYLNTTDTSVTTVTVAGLGLRSWDVYVYMDGDNGSLTRTAAYRISGSGITTTSVNATDSANTNFTASFTRATNSAGNYVKFTVTAAGFTITATPGTSTGTRRAPVNAIQIVPVP